MKLKLTDVEQADLLPKIQAVLDTGEPWNDETIHFPVEAIVSAVLSVKGMNRKVSEESRNGFDTNGWQYDWWQNFTFKGKDYVLSGSGYYGGHAFELSE